MKRLLFILLFLVAALASKAQPSSALESEKTRVLIILDCSNSMWDHWQSNSKIKITQTVLLKFLDSIANEPNFDVALRVFGHLNKDAYGTKLEVPFGANNNYKIQSKIKTLVPQGGCTISSALTNSLNDFPASSNTRNIILIITDGMDDCDGNICHVARQVQMSGVIVQTFILGIGNAHDFQSSLDCAGKFTYVPNEEQYTETLYNIFRMSGEEARVVFNIHDETDHLYETNIPMALYDAQTGVVKYTTIYSIDDRYIPDTLIVDPLVNYDITLFTKPEIEIRGKQFSAGRTNRVDVALEQGSLRLRHEMRRTTLTVPNYTIVVHKQGETAVLNTQAMGEQNDYLAGTYDLEVLSMPVLKLEGVTIQNSSHTDLTIPMPGLLNLSKPKAITTGDIFLLEEGRLTWVCNLSESKTSERIMLMPGEYQLVLTPTNTTHYSAVQTQRFVIEAGLQTNVLLSNQNY